MLNWYNCTLVQEGCIGFVIVPTALCVGLHEIDFYVVATSHAAKQSSDQKQGSEYCITVSVVHFPFQLPPQTCMHEEINCHLKLVIYSCYII